MIEVKELPVVACLPFHNDGGPGFALPLLAHPTSPLHRVVQEVDEHLDVIGAFKTLEGEIAGAIALPNGPIARLGGEMVYAFVTEDGIAHAGTLAELEPTLRAFVRLCANRPAVSLQIMELVGTGEDQRRARVRMRGKLAREAGSQAAHAFYEGSVLRSVLWKRLVDGATNAEAARRILDVRAQVDLKVQEDGLIGLDLSVLDPKDYAMTSAATLITELQHELNFLSSATTAATTILDLSDAAVKGVIGNAVKRGYITHEQINSVLPSEEVTSAQIEGVLDLFSGMGVDVVEADEPTKVDATTILSRINKLSRQEERIAALLDEILKDRNAGISALSEYRRDRGRFANTALSHIRERMASKETSQVRDELIVASLISRFYTDAFPFNRGALLYFLAKHLAKYPSVSRAIRQSLDRSASIYVNRVRHDIEHLLNAGLDAAG